MSDMEGVKRVRGTPSVCRRRYLSSLILVVRPGTSYHYIGPQCLEAIQAIIDIGPSHGMAQSTEAGIEKVSQAEGYVPFSTCMEDSFLLLQANVERAAAGSNRSRVASSTRTIIRASPRRNDAVVTECNSIIIYPTAIPPLQWQTLPRHPRRRLQPLQKPILLLLQTPSILLSPPLPWPQLPVVSRQLLRSEIHSKTPQRRIRLITMYRQSSQIDPWHRRLRPVKWLSIRGLSLFVRCSLISTTGFCSYIP